MIRRLIILLLIVGCDNPTKYKEPSVTEFPNQIDNFWEYSCSETIGDNYRIGYSYVKIIDNLPNDVINSSDCGNNNITFEKIDSVFTASYELETNVKIDSVIYTIEENNLSRCLATNLTNNSYFYPLLPTIQYPLFIGKNWQEEFEPLQTTITYEVIDSKWITTAKGYHNCYIIKKMGLGSLETYYYISPAGLIKIHYTFENLELWGDSPDASATEIVNATFECNLVNYSIN